MSTKQPRGIRLNNPGNIRHGKDKWQGMSEKQDDKSFIRFDTPQAGIRALARTLITYEKKGYNTVASIVGRWAPENENDTDAYVADVAGDLGVSSSDVLDVDSYEVMLPLVKSIIAHENANYAYPEKVVIDAIRMAGVHGTPHVKLTQSNNFKTQVVTAVTTTAAVASTAAKPLKDAADGLDPFTGSPIIQQVVIGLLTIAGVATFAGIAGSWLKARKGL